MVLEPAAFGEDGAEDAADAGSIERASIAIKHGLKNDRLTGFIGDGKAVFALEAGDFRNGLGAPIDETEKFEVEFVNRCTLLSKSLGHGAALLSVQKHKSRERIAAG
jgi:hypothetical protein